ncbi:MAG: cytochrome c biogenesis protein CcsA [Myxococcales bacterium]|nr:cytochrome c biogenesis protein CcsA [Myxococcales bacterium]
MAALGSTTIYLTLILAAWALALGIVGARRRSRALVASAEAVTYAVAACATVAMFILAYAFAVSDFSIIYVQQHSDRSMPLFYRITATWGGMEGSLLLWAWLLSIFTAFAVRTNRERLRELMPYFIATQMTIMLFFGSLLVTASNPFGSFLAFQATTGKGLNPLLQNPYMVTHPPSLYLGFVGMSVPFSMGMAALLSGRTDNAWVMAARRWAMLAWFFLSLGLTLGMLWAYEELGWGGYWGWDPVENAGFMPWLMVTAFLHSIIVQERRSMLRIWNMILATLAFAMTIFGTFLTRSGFIESVHAFARSNIGYVFLAFIWVTLCVGFALTFWRRKQLRSRGELESVLSREFWFVLNNWLFLSATLLVMVLTTFPSLSELFGDKITISIPAFNRWMAPLGIALLVMTGIGPMLGWRKTSGAGLRRQFLIPLAVSIAAGAVLAVIGLRKVNSLIVWVLCVFITATIVQELVRGTASRAKAAKVSLASSFFGLFARNRRRYGGYIIHFGIVLMFVGFAGDAYKLENEVVMKRGQRHKIGDYTLRYDGLRVTEDAEKTAVTAYLTTWDKGKHIGTLLPARWTFHRHRDAPTTEVAMKRGIREDLFVALGDFNSKTGSTTFKIVVNPLVNWIWFGFIVLGIGTAVAALPIGGRLSKIAGVTAAVALLLLPPGVADAKQERAPPKAGSAKHDHSDHEHAGMAKMLFAPGEKVMFDKLTCMCNTCPRLILSKCNCGFAQRERKAIRAKLKLGWDEKRIIDWYVNRRGPEIGREPFGFRALSEPPNTGLYWMLPYALSAIGVIALVLAGRKWSARRRARAAAAALAAAGGDLDSRSGGASRKKDDPYADLLDDELRKLD